MYIHFINAMFIHLFLGIDFKEISLENKKMK